MRTRVEELFHALADLPPEVRAGYFAEHNIDADTRGAVEGLLAFDSPSGTTLDREIGQVASSALARADGRDLRCGPYCLKGLLGRGGMGSVYLAERVDGEIAQRVAVKILLPGADHPQLRQRFLAERQILAALSHPNIATLLDAGHREDGQPYLVMEYIEGQAIDAYTTSFSIRRKITLFLKVCAAVSYLHRNLVVHRDLKPANILVTGDGEPKLLDFGIAKMLDLTTDSTVTSLLMFTPDYASPEQLAGGPVSTATDIYSLGAVLYKLLTAVSPHRFEGESAAGIALAIPNPLITPPAKLAPALKGDLEIILMKALRREPQERYATIEQFSEDVENYLESRPIRARKGDAWYRTRKFLSRQWLPLTASALAVGGLLAGMLVANHQRAIAQRRFGEVRQLANVFLFQFERSIRDIPGTLDARNLVASTGQRYLKELAAESRYDPTLEREIAEAYERLADIQDSIRSSGGSSPGDTDTLLQSLEIHRRLGDDQSANPWLRRKYIEMASLLAYRYQDERNAREAARWADEAVALSAKWVAAEPRSVDALASATFAYTRGATTQEVSGHIADALLSLDRSVNYGERALATVPGDTTVRILVADSHRIYSELAGHRRQIRGRIGDGLQTRLFIHRDRHHRYHSAILILQCDLLINQQNLAHFGFEFRIASFQIVLHLLRMQRLISQDSVHGRFGGVSQRPVACPRGVLAHMPGQRAPRPHLRRITEILRLGTGQMNYPGFGIFGDRGFFGTVVCVFQRRTGTHRQSLGHPLPYALAGHAHGTGNLRDVLAGMIAQHDSRPLRFPPRCRPRIPQALEVLDLLGAQFQLGSLRPARHTISVALNILLWLCFSETLY